MITVDLNNAELDRVLRHLERAAVQLGPVFDDIGQHLVNTTRRRFEDGKAPDGSTWTKNSAVTLARKKGKKPLVGESGGLSTEIQSQADARRLRVGSNKEYAAMQHFGGKKNRFPHLWGDIPARPFVGLSSEDEGEVQALLLDHLYKAAKR